MQQLPQGCNGGFRGGSGREGPVKAHGFEALLHILEGLLADDDVAADDQGDTLQTGFVSLLTQAAAVQLALAIQGRNHDGIGIGFDGGCNVLFLGDHNTQVHHLKTGFGKCVVQDLVAHGVDIGADDANDKNLLFSVLHNTPHYKNFVLRRMFVFPRYKTAKTPITSKPCQKQC